MLILEIRLRCVSITPFGNPVVPLENGRIATSSQDISTFIGGNDFPRDMRS